METLNTQHQQAHTTVRPNRLHLTLEDEGDGLGRLRILELGKFLLLSLHMLHSQVN